LTLSQNRSNILTATSVACRISMHPVVLKSYYDPWILRSEFLNSLPFLQTDRMKTRDNLVYRWMLILLTMQTYPWRRR